MTLFDRALAVATEAHTGQTDKAGHPYILHPCAVAAAVASHGEVAMAVALLHDVVEDTEVEIDDIRSAFGEEVSVPVGLLTKVNEDDDYDEYLKGVAADPVAATVKLADMRHNVGRVDQLGPEKAAEMRQKYEPRIKWLEANRKTDS